MAREAKDLKDAAEPPAVDPRRDVTGALHDVSNALTVLLGWVAEARAPGAPPEAVAYALRIVEQRARVARDLARRAIGGPRLDANGRLEAALAEALDALAVEAQLAKVKLARRGDPGTISIVAAADATQVITNVVLNALAHSPRGGEVRVIAAVSNEQVSIDIEDDGPGVAEARKDSIFQGDSLREGGTGVGLRHARALARAVGGDVVLAARKAARGATFSITWPRAEMVPRPPVSAAALSSRAHKQLDGARILVVEDDVAVTQLLESALTARGAEVKVARSAAELTAALADSGSLNAALIDLSPIAADVTGAFSALRAAAPSAVLVVVTGSADALPDLGEGAAGQKVRLVRKPFEVAEIVAALTSPEKK